jgi:hypothetical protein
VLVHNQDCQGVHTKKFSYPQAEVFRFHKIMFVWIMFIWGELHIERGNCINDCIYYRLN